MGAPKLKILKEQVKASSEGRKPKLKKEWQKAGACAGVGALAGVLEGGGAMGIAAFGGAVGVPLVVAGAGVGLAGYGLYKTYKAIKKDGW